MKTVIICLTLAANSLLHASSRYVSYEDIRKEGGFASDVMLTDWYVVASEKTPLTETEKENLLSSNRLSSVRTLDLSGQNIDDEFVKKLAGNASLARLMTIDISNNPQITDASLEYIQESTVLGSIRDLQQVSARYGNLATTVVVKCRGTAITKTKIDPVFYFHIDYKHPVYNTSTAEPTEMGIKLLEIAK